MSDAAAGASKRPTLLVNYAKSFGTFVALLPPQVAFPCVVVVGFRGNSLGHPRGIEADFLQFVATAKAAFPGEWPDKEITGQNLRFDGGRLIVNAGGVDYWLEIDRHCPVTLYSCTAPPDEFAGVTDPDLLAAFLSERPHATTPLSLEMRVPQMQIYAEKAPSSPAPHAVQKPLYERPSTGKTLAWLAIGIALVAVGARWLGMGISRGVAVNFYAWAMIVLGAVIIVRRCLDLIFPPSRL
jgi:hypothetical protein